MFDFLKTLSEDLKQPSAMLYAEDVLLSNVIGMLTCILPF